MYARNAHLTDEKEIKAKLDLAEFIKKGKLQAQLLNTQAERGLTFRLPLARMRQRPRHSIR